MHAEIATLFSLLLEALHVNANSRLMHALLLKVDVLQPHTALVAGLVNLGYQGLLLWEGVGQWLERSWAAYLPVISTSLLLPFELYEVIDRISVLRVGVLVLNLVIVLYLVGQLKKHALGSQAVVPSDP